MNVTIAKKNPKKQHININILQSILQLLRYFSLEVGVLTSRQTQIKEVRDKTHNQPAMPSSRTSGFRLNREKSKKSAGGQEVN